MTGRPDFQPPVENDAHSQRPSDVTTHVALEEIGQRIRIAVYGLIMTSGLFVLTLTPWIESYGSERDLWRLSGEGVSITAHFIPLSVLVTTILGVIASAEGTRRTARAASILAAISGVLSLISLAGLTDDTHARAGWYVAMVLLAIFTVVFGSFATGAPDGRLAGRRRIWLDPRGWLSWRAAEPARPVGRPRDWMDPTFGTVDRDHP